MRIEPPASTGQLPPSALLDRFIDSVHEAPIEAELRAEIVINLAKSWDIDDDEIRGALIKRWGPDAAEHSYFHWRPRPRYFVGHVVRIVEGPDEFLGHCGRVTGLESPKRFGVRGMGRGFFCTIVLDSGATRGFGEDQLEGQ